MSLSVDGYAASDAWQCRVGSFLISVYWLVAQQIQQLSLFSEILITWSDAPYA